MSYCAGGNAIRCPCPEGGGGSLNSIPECSCANGIGTRRPMLEGCDAFILLGRRGAALTQINRQSPASRLNRGLTCEGVTSAAPGHGEGQGGHQAGARQSHGDAGFPILHRFKAQLLRQKSAWYSAGDPVLATVPVPGTDVSPTVPHGAALGGPARARDAPVILWSGSAGAERLATPDGLRCFEAPMTPRCGRLRPCSQSGPWTGFA
jgi:hypothetical protein